MRSLVVLAVITLSGCSSHHPQSPDKINVTRKNASKSWMGTWERRLWQNEATLEIKTIKVDSLEFTLSASSGGHTGDIDGVAIAAGSIARFQGIDPGDSCFIEFTLVDDSVIRIEEKGGSCPAGIGVVYSGEYKNSKVLSPVKKDETLFDLGIFENEKQDSIFKSLVGDSYLLFVNSTQLTSDDDDLDSIHATVHSSGVRGLFTSMENIVMIDSSNNIWAAVIDDNKVYYFTNNEGYKNRLPKTIDNWRQRFKNYKIVYK